MGGVFGGKVTFLRQLPPKLTENSDDHSTALRQTAFPLFWSARVLSSAGFQIAGVVIGWQVYALTGSVLDLGLVGLAQFLPMLVLTLPAGHAADRYDRRSIVFICQLLEAGIMAILALASYFGFITAPMVFLLAGLFGAARTFEAPATSALLPALVPAPLYPRAIALSSSANQTASIIGPAIGGGLYIAGAQWAYGAVCLSLLLASILVSRLVSTRLAPRREKVTLQSLFSGFSFIRHSPVVLGAISLDMVAVLLGGATALFPVFAQDVLHTGPLGLGVLRASPAAGALAMSLILSRRPMTDNIGVKMFLAVATFGVATIVFGLSSQFPVSMAALVLMGAADVVSVVIRSSLVQLATPDAMRGRVGAINSMFIGTSNQLGEFESGMTAALLGAPAAVIAGGLGTLAVALVWSRYFPDLREMRKFPARQYWPAP